LVPLFLAGQTEQEIKLSGYYYWGEGEHEVEENARSAAIQDMLFKIQVTVHSELTTVTEESDQGIRDDARSVVQAHTSMRLKGLNFYTTTRRGRYRVIAYIAKSDYARGIDLMAAEIAADAAGAELDEQQSGLPTAIMTYYLTYLKTFQCPKAIHFITQNGMQYDNLQIFLKNRIESYLSALDIRTGDVTIDASIPMITIPVHVRYQGKPLSRLTARLDHPDGADMPIVDGKTRFYLYTLPSRIKEEYQIFTAIHLDPKTTPEDLLAMHLSFPLTYPKKISLDFTQIIKLDFNVYRQASGAMLFNPVYKNISISALSWDFGDGESSTDQKPLHRYEEEKEHIVSLTFNNNPALRIMKTLSPDGKTTPYASSQPEPQPKISSPVLKDLSLSRTYEELSRKLILYKKKHQLMYGKESTFLKPENCYIFVVNPQTKEVIALLDQGMNTRQNMLTGEMVDNISRHYRGMVSIFTEVYE
jgi:hypothetical protein